MKAEVCHHLFLVYGSQLRVWCWASLATSSVSVQYPSPWNTHGAYRHSSAKLSQRPQTRLSCPVCHGAKEHLYPLICSLHCLWCPRAISNPLSVRQRWKYTVSDTRGPPWQRPPRTPYSRGRSVASSPLFPLPTSPDWWFPIPGQNKFIFSSSISLS